MKKVLTALLTIGLLLPVFCFGEVEDKGKSFELKAEAEEKSDQLNADELVNLESVVIGVKYAEKAYIGKDADVRIFYNGDNIDKDRDLFIFYKKGYIVNYEIVDEKGKVVSSGSSIKEVKSTQTSAEKDKLEQAPKFYLKSDKVSEDTYKEIKDYFPEELFINTSKAKDGCKLTCSTYKKGPLSDDDQTFVGSCTFKKGPPSDDDQTFVGTLTFKEGPPPDDELVLVGSRTFNIIEPRWQYLSLENISIAPIMSIALGKKSNNQGSKSNSADFGLGISYMFFHKSEKFNKSGNILLGVNTSFSRTDILNESTNEMEPTTVLNLCGSLAYKFSTFLIQGNVGYGNVTGKDHYLLVSLGFGKLL